MPPTLLPSHTRMQQPLQPRPLTNTNNNSSSNSTNSRVSAVALEGLVEEAAANGQCSALRRLRGRGALRLRQGVRLRVLRRGSLAVAVAVAAVVLVVCRRVERL